MKLKGISIVERHFEKAVVALFALTAVGVSVYEFAFNSTSVKVGSQQMVVSRVVPELEARAAALNRGLENPSTTSEIPQVTTMASESFRQSRDASVSPSQSIRANAPSFAGLISSMDSIVDSTYFSPSYGAPIEINCAQYFDALLDESIVGVPSLESRFANSTGPKDIDWVTPVAKINLADVRAQLAGEDATSTPPLTKIPESWFLHSVFFLDVVFERETLLPSGRWGDSMTVASIPWQQTIRAEIEAGKLNATRRDEILSALTVHSTQLELIQPSFPPTRMGRGTDPASDLASGVPVIDTSAPVTADPEQAKARERARLERQISAEQRSLDTLVTKLKDAGGELSDAEFKKRQKDRDDAKRNKGMGGGGFSGKGSGGGGGGLGGGGGGTMGGGGMAGRRGTNAQSGTSEADADKLRRNLTKSRDSKIAKVADYSAQLTALGGKAPVVTAAVVAKSVDLAADGTIDVWTHDLDVRLGETYRYRATVQLFNPFFGRKSLLTNEQSELAENIVKSATSSGWSAPIRLRTDRPFYLTHVGQGLSGPHATFEVYRVFDGAVRMEPSDVTSGDSIGEIVTDGSNKGLDFETGWFVAAIKRQARAAAESGSESFIVVIQNSVTGERYVERFTMVDSRLPDRARLREELAQADAGKGSIGDAPTPPFGGPSGEGGSGSGPPKLGS
ncbi:MAG: hypothetical protein O2855_06880 [Planctomycetota bacterium]|nr:hypothetical protein [Planctomycetota bacterium]